MNKSIVLAGMMLASTAHAALRVDVELNVDGKTLVQRCEYNQEAGLWSAQENGLRVEAVAQPEGDDVVITMHIFKNDAQNQPVLISNPVFKTTWGHPARLQLSNKKGETMAAQVVVTQ
jgi:hypothetical protein